MNKFARKKSRKMFLEAISNFAFEKTFSEFPYKMFSLLYMISLAYQNFHFLSANHNPELRCVICPGVTLFALVLHLNCTRALSQSESSNFFMCIIILGICENNIEYQGFTLQYMEGDWKNKSNIDCFQS